MSDQAEAPPKKIGSLRDRIAAFEKAGAGSAGPAPAPPPPRPKPAGFSSWKPRPPSPTSGEPSQAAAPAKPSAGLSTADAKESITKGQSLKERMAALQGKGGFGAPPPVAPKPALEKPKWKPPPAIAAPKDDDDGDDQPRKPLDLEGIVKSPPAEHSGEKVAGEGEAKESSSAEGEEATEVDPEEEERQRRAAIAARMARLGGARVGMAPPTVFGKRPPPPPKKRSSVSEDAVLSDTPKEAVTSPKLQATEPETVPIETVPNVPSPPSESTAGTPPSSQSTPARRPSEAGSLASIESSESHHSSRSPPVSMPVPAAPRRAAPPRKKPVKPTAPPPPVPEVEGEQQEETSTSTAEPVTEAVLPKAALATALPTSPTPAETAGTVPVSSNEVLETATNEPPAAFLPPEVTENTDNRLATPEAAKPQSIVEEPETNAEDEKEYEVENEVELDEETKRRQVAERVARMGGVNPFSASVLPRRQSSNTSEASVQPPPTVEKESEQPASPPAVSQSRRSSKLSEAPLSPLHPAAQEKRLSRGSVDSSRAEVGAQGPTVGEPSEIEEEEESAMDEGLLVLKQTKVLDQSPAVTKRETPQQTRTLVKEDSAEDDGDSEYSNDDEDHKPSVDTLPTPLSVPHHPVHRSPEAPHRSAPPPPPPALFEDEDEDEDAALQEANEDMIRSQILIPPTKEAHDEDTPLTPRKEGTDQSAYPEEGGVAYDDTGSEYEEEEEEEILPFTQPPVRDAAPSFMPPPPPPGRPNLPARSPPPPANRGLPPAPPTIVHTTSQDSLKVPAPVEVLDDDEGDPIDPSFHSPSRRTSQVLPSTSVTPPEDTTAVADAPAPQEQQGPPESQEDAEAVRRRTIAERMAKLGGIKFGAAPPAPGAPKRPPPPPQREEEDGEAHEAEGSQGQPEEDEEAEERARKERIATKLAGMGGMRIGMMPSAFPPRKSHVLTEEPAAPALPSRGPPARALPPPQAHESESEVEGSTTSEDAVKVEVDESDLEEVLYEDVEEEPAPPIPSRASRPIRRESAEAPPLASSPPTRPPVPSGLPPRRPSIKSVSSQRRVSGESTMSPPPSQRRPSAPKSHPSEYVMVEEPQNYEEETPPLPPNRPAGRRTSGPPTRSPPPPLPEDSLSSQWELPAIPTSNLDLGSNDLEMSWTEAEAPREVDSVVPPAPSIRRQSGVQYPPQPPPIHGASTQSSVSSSDLHLSADDLMALWGRVGVQVCEAATILFERSKKGLVGDGTYPGFIHAVIREVPNALPTADYGYLIYKQNGASVQKRASDIMPGDLVELHDAKLKGHKGLQGYHQTVGADEPVVGVIGEFDAKKSKIKVFQANQHVGQQTVESVSYRLEDLKSGVVKVYRVLEAQ